MDKDFQGFQGLVHNRRAHPLVGQFGFQIRPGSHNLVTLSATQVVADEGVRTLEPKDRGCRFDDENQGLVLYKKYSQASCYLECALNYAREKFLAERGSSCVPWFLPFAGNRSDESCDPWQAQEFVKVAVSHSSCSQCLPGCKKTIYQQMVTTLPFRRCDDSNFDVSPMCTLVIVSFCNSLILLPAGIFAELTT